MRSTQSCRHGRRPTKRKQNRCRRFHHHHARIWIKRRDVIPSQSIGVIPRSTGATCTTAQTIRPQKFLVGNVQVKNTGQSRTRTARFGIGLHGCTLDHRVCYTDSTNSEYLVPRTWIQSTDDEISTSWNRSMASDSGSGSIMCNIVHCSK